MSDQPAKEKEKKRDLCVFCDAELPDEDVVSFCHICGGKVPDTHPDNLLDIKIDTDDIESFIFSGSITRTIKIRNGIYARMRTLNDDETKKCMMKADAEIAKHGSMAQDTMMHTRNQYLMKKMLIGISDTDGKSDDVFKKPKKIGGPLMDILIYKSNLLREAINVALQTDKVIDF